MFKRKKIIINSIEEYLKKMKKFESEKMNNEKCDLQMKNIYVIVLIVI